MIGLAAAAAAAALLGCEPSAAPPAPDVLRVSAIPDQSPERVRAQHEPLMQQVCALARVRCELVAVATYEDLVARLGRGEIDLAYLGGVTFAQARHRHRVEPLAMRDIDRAFTSVVVVRADDAARGLDDLKGRSFAFGNASSTSGHFMARSKMNLAGIDPERDFGSVAYSGAHDETLRWVGAGRVDAGVVNASVYLRAIRAGDGLAQGLRVLWQTPPYTDYVWAARAGLPADLRSRLRDAFLDLSPSDPQQRAALDREGAKGYVPAYLRDFDEVIDIVGQRGAL